MLKIIILAALILSCQFFLIEPLSLSRIFSRAPEDILEERILGEISGFNDHVKEIQLILTDLGLEEKEVNGRMNARTRSFIRDFQKARNLEPSGRIDAPTLKELYQYKELAQRHNKNNFKKSKIVNEKFPETIQERILKSLAKEVKKKMESKNENSMTKTEEIIPDPRVKHKERIKEIQVALANSRFYTGKVDGKFGPQTKSALKAFQKSKGLKADSIVGPKTWEELKKHLKQQ